MTRRAIIIAAASLWLGCGSGDETGGSGLSEATGTTTFDTTAGDGDTGDGEEGGDDSGAQWGPENEFALRIDDTPPPPLELNMDKAEVDELFGPVGDEILLLELDPTDLLRNTLDEIKTACGTDWQNDVANPTYDCDSTALGQTFSGPDGTAATSAELALIRILTMTPANSKVEGTSIEGMQELADLLNLGGGFSQILADSMAIARTEEFIDTDPLVVSLQENFLKSHAYLGQFDGKIPFTLRDALLDLAPLKDKLGPMGAHPGVVDPSFDTFGQVFGPQFQMSVVADSNLRVLDGADAGVGKGFISVIADTTGPTFNDEAEFDFNDPEKFTVTGIVDSPTVDMRFRVNEFNSFVPACFGDEACKQNAPDNPVGTGTAFHLQPWLLEYNIAWAGRQKYQNLTNYQGYLCIIGCSAEVLVGQDGDPPGWARFEVLLNLGNPPPDQFVWELLNEVAQVQLHETPAQSFPEGTMSPAFTLRDIPVGLTGEEAAEATRPFLQEQSSEIAGFLLGDFKKNSDDVDFYYRRASNGAPMLYFVIPEDLEEGKPYGWARPGFYSSPSITEESKISSTVVAGVADDAHEKLQLASGVSEAYIQDDEGDIFRLTFVVPDGDPKEITVSIARRIQ